jgi:hypothetical protein
MCAAKLRSGCRNATGGYRLNGVHDPETQDFETGKSAIFHFRLSAA